MLQRIQSVFFILILVLVVTLCFLPIYNITLVNGEQSFITFRKLPQLKVLMLSILIIPLLAIIAIFTYKNRKRQLLISYTGLLLSLTLFALCLTFPEVFSSAYLLNMPGHPLVDYGMGIYLIGLLPVLFILAVRAIRKDEKLVRESDRLR